MLKRFEGFTIWSEDYKKLALWYERIFKLKKAMEIDIPDDKAIAFVIDPSNDMYLWIGFHSKVKGSSKDPYRLMISYIVDDVYRLYDEIKEQDVTVVSEPHASPDGQLNVLTLMDPEQNLIQLFSMPKSNIADNTNKS